MNRQPPQVLTSEKLQLFIAGLAGLPPEEIRKAKILFLKNELSELRAQKATMDGFGTAQGCLAIIPVFWPIIAAQRSAMKAHLTKGAEQISNAIAVWKEDLGDAGPALEAELANLRSGPPSLPP